MILRIVFMLKQYSEEGYPNINTELHLDQEWGRDILFPIVLVPDPLSVNTPPAIASARYLPQAV